MVIFDEIHQLRDPARVLKIGAEGFPKLKILATGSSTLAASRALGDSFNFQISPEKTLHFGRPPHWSITAHSAVLHDGLNPGTHVEFVVDVL